MITPTLKKPAAAVAPTIGARSTASGMNGSGARMTRSTNSSHSIADAASKPNIGGDDQA